MYSQIREYKIIRIFSQIILYIQHIVYIFFTEERTSLARIRVTLVCCELLQKNGTNPKTAACILMFVTALHDATAANCGYHSETAIARVNNAHFEDPMRSEDLDICANC